MKQRFSTRTRLVSALLTLAMVCTFLPFSAFAEVQTYVPLNNKCFPDETFRNRLEKFDKDYDGYLSTVEREAVKEIIVRNMGISNLKGIEFFPNLKYLNCSGNELTSLDVHENTALERLSCAENKLSSLDVSNNTALDELYCYNNQLTSLDVRQNTALKMLSCSKNKLTSLDVSQNTALKELHCDRNQLTELDVSKNTELAGLYCYENQLTELDVSKNAELVSLACNGNRLTSLDVSQNAKLVNLYCDDNQLTELDVSKNTALKTLVCGANQLSSLDVSKNTALKELSCNQNQLSSLDVSRTAVTSLDASNNMIDINVEETPRTFDLSTLPGFDVTKATEWKGGTVSGKTLKVKPGVTQVTYTYDCGKGFSRYFNLNVIVIPDGSIVIDDLNFPDPDFRTYVKAEFDKDNDNFLSGSERNAVTEIAVSNKGITTLEGIQHFPNLEKLDCDQNNLSSLDVSKNSALKYLYCEQDNLSSLDVSKNPALEYLKCEQNNLSSLDVSKNAALKYLNCEQNSLTSLDVSKNEALMYLNCKNNQLTNLNVEYTNIDPSFYLSELRAQDNTYSIAVESNRAFDLSTLPGAFDVTKASGWVGGTVNGSILTVDDGATEVTYSYDCGRGLTREFSLQVLTKVKQVNIRVTTPKKGEMPDETVIILDNGADVCDVKIRWGMGDIGGEPIPGSFQTGKRYTLQVGLYAKPGYKFSEETVCTVNGQETKFFMTMKDDTEYYATRSYVVPLTPGGFEHDHKMEMTHDEHSHWMECPICHTVQDTEAHVYDDDKDTTCNVCGYVRSLTPETPDPGTTPGGGTGTTTPPSGGEGTGTTTPPSGGEGTGTTTPPSGGEGTGTTTPPSGGGTGTTTPPSGGGTGTTTPPSGGEGTGTTTPPSGGEGTGTTTPPSGGEGTGTTTPPSGGGTGTTTPPSGGEGTGTTTPPSGGDGGGGAIVMVAGAAVAGVVGYGVYNYVSGQKLQALLPEGVAAPENRAQTALLLWNTAGRPEPAEAPAFADVADPDTAKAAQWCVEQGLMKRRLNGKFAPDSNIPAYQVLNAYRKLAG